jgi:primase-polymerase (primpol)-like protein
MHRPTVFDGIGVVILEDMGVVGVDLDNCRDPRSGTLSPTAADIIRSFAGAYVEVSVSGTGVHILAPGRYVGDKNWPTRKPEDGTGLEIYRADRYFTLTGKLIDRPEEEPNPTERDYSDALQALYDKFFKPTTKPATRDTRTVAPLDHSSIEANVEPLTRLFRGRTPFMQETARYYRDGIREGDNPSEADFRLVLALLYVTDEDPTMTDSLFRSSALFRPDKWDSRRGDTTYGWMTISNAMKARGRRAS